MNIGIALTRPLGGLAVNDVVPNKPILVTGSHRSGTTWVGRIIAASPSVGYIHEPFHIGHDVGMCGARFPHWFTYISERNEKDAYEPMKKTISFRYNLTAGLKGARTSRAVGRTLVTYVEFFKYRMMRARPLLKDPIAILSAEWLATRFDMNVVVLIRHPAAFVCSIKTKGWSHPFSHFREQPFLIEDHFSPFKEEINSFADRRVDPIDQAALLWKLIHYMILKYRTNHPSWIFIRHEDLSSDPLGGFKALLDKLNVVFSQPVANAIVASTSTTSQRGLLSRRGDSIHRKGTAHLHAWRGQLTTSEIDRVRSVVNDVSKEFYSDQEW